MFFADPHSPWQKAHDENTRWTSEDLAAVAYTLSNRPRKALDWKTPAEVFTEQLRSIKQASVATTG